MRLLLATDAWHPQVNGVVRSLEQTAAALARSGIETEYLTPASFATVPMPSYPEIRLALATSRRVGDLLDRAAYGSIHVATEGPIGLAVRRSCLLRGVPFTTSYHTRFPEYLRSRLPVPLRWSYAWLRRFHGAAAVTMVSTARLRDELAARRFARLAIWSRGVDTDLFRPEAASGLDLPGPIFLYVGRLAVEKNLDAFLSADLPGTKVIVGGGPERDRLAARYPSAAFLGVHTGAALAAIYASADVFVFPSFSDTFGIVLLEALASGVPVAAFPVAGPLDVIGRSGVGVLGADLAASCLAALTIDRERCRAFALRWSWERSAAEFASHLVPARDGSGLGARGATPVLSVPPPLTPAR